MKDMRPLFYWFISLPGAKQQLHSYFKIKTNQPLKIFSQVSNLFSRDRRDLHMINQDY
jgi:lipid-A-disaccharide synthase-like uncharacterized protein